MKLVTALTYWLIVALWAGVLTTLAISYLREARQLGAMRLLLAVLAIDILRNIIENTYFGFFFGAQYGLFPASLVGTLGNPALLIMPKIINAIAAVAVLALLLRRWLPAAVKEKNEASEALRRASDALRQEAEDRRRLFETSLDLIFITDRRGSLIQVSPSSKAILGYEPREMVGRSAKDFIYPGDLERTRQEMRLARSGLDTRNFETRYLHKNGRVVTLAWSGVWSSPEQRHYFFGRDMTERSAAEERLRHLAYHDHLTGLPNRNTLRADIAAILSPKPSAAVRSCALALVDLDRFKDVNDQLGHAVGDSVLEAIARRIWSGRRDIRLYRLGADEFGILFPDTADPTITVREIEEALSRVAEALEIKDRQLFLTASSGIALAPSHGLDVEELVGNADLALQEAKAAGGNRCQLFMTPLRAKAQSRWQLDAELRRACSEREFVLYYQPQVRLSDGMITGAEALLRWQHPERGVIAPAAFIEQLAESAVALDLGRWILGEACRQAAEWSDLGWSVKIGVNFFPCQFFSGSLLEDVNRALSESGLAANRLELEITENIALKQDRALIAHLHALRSRGVSIAFDDFGTGYASLIYLRQYPLNRIKIDQGFVRKISDRSPPKDAAMIRSIIQMAHNLGLAVVAEGVETADQEAFLRAEKCDEVQGYFYSRPMSAGLFTTLLRSRGSRTPSTLAG